MKKNTISSETSSTEGVINPDLFFCNDSFVVDYLSALLTSAPPLILDSGEVHFTHMSTGAGWNNLSTSAVNSPIFFESQMSRVEAETIRSENEKLKFKTELAKIDTQVLRNENDNLQGEVASLKAEIGRIKYFMEAVRTENRELKSVVKQQQEQLEDIIQQRIDAEPVPEVETSAEEKEMVVDPVEVSRQKVLYVEETEPPVEEEKTMHPEVTPDSAPPRTLSAGANPVQVGSGGLDIDIAYISGRKGNDAPRSQNPDRSTVIFSSDRGNAGEAGNPRAVSKVIKQVDSKEDSLKSEAKPILKITTLDVFNSEVPENKTEEPIHDSIQAETAAEPENPLENDSGSVRELQPNDETGDIDMPPAPAPKVVVKRNVKNYEDLQKESESAGEPLAGHTLVL